MAAKGYTTIALPNSLIEEVEALIKQKKRGYKTRPEFIKDAIRRLLDQLNLE